MAKLLSLDSGQLDDVQPSPVTGRDLAQSHTGLHLLKSVSGCGHGFHKGRPDEIRLPDR